MWRCGNGSGPRLRSLHSSIADRRIVRTQREPILIPDGAASPRHRQSGNPSSSLGLPASCGGASSLASPLFFPSSPTGSPRMLPTCGHRCAPRWMGRPDSCAAEWVLRLPTSSPGGHPPMARLSRERADRRPAVEMRSLDPEKVVLRRRIGVLPPRHSSGMAPSRLAPCPFLPQRQGAGPGSCRLRRADAHWIGRRAEGRFRTSSAGGSPRPSGVRPRGDGCSPMEVRLRRRPRSGDAPRGPGGPPIRPRSPSGRGGPSGRGRARLACRTAPWWCRAPCG